MIRPFENVSQKQYAKRFTPNGSVLLGFEVSPKRRGESNFNHQTIWLRIAYYYNGKEYALKMSAKKSPIWT